MMSIFLTDGADCSKSPFDSSFADYVSKVNYKGPLVSLEAPCNESPCCVIAVCQNSNDRDCSTYWKWEVFRAPLPSRTPSTTPSLAPPPSSTGSSTGTDSATPSPGSSPTPSPTVPEAPAASASGAPASASGSSSISSPPLPGDGKTNGGLNSTTLGSSPQPQALSSSQEDAKSALVVGVSVSLAVLLLVGVAAGAVLYHRRGAKSTPALSGKEGTAAQRMQAPGAAGGAAQQPLPPTLHMMPVNNPLRM